MLEVLFVLLTLSIMILILVAPPIALLVRLIKKTRFIRAWAITSGVLIAVFTLIMLMASPALIVNHFEDKSYIQKTDQKFEELKSAGLAEEPTTDVILMEIFKTGSFKRGRRSGSTGNPNASYVIKNYNDRNFTGKVILSAIYNGESIGEREIELELDANEELGSYVSPSKLNVTREMWRDVTFDYAVHGEFEP